MSNKKGAKNAFMFFLSDFKEEQKKKGIIFNNINEAINAADPVWRDLSRSEKAKYDNMVQKQKQKLKNAEKKYTSTGIPISMIENAEKEELEYKELERKDIKNLVNSRVVNNSLITMDIYLMDVNCYCKIEQNYIVGEFTLLRFNIKDGIKETYHEIINPGPPPIGYTYQMMLGSEEFGLEIHDENVPRSNYMQILANIVDYLKLQDHKTNVLPPIFALPEKVQQVQNFILQMCQRAGEDETLFRVYKLDTLLFTLVNALKAESDEGFPKESLATLHLKKDTFKYTPGIACEYHEGRDRLTECSQARVRRGAYGVLDVAARQPVPGRHLPRDYHLPALERYREGRAPPPAATLHAPPASCNSSMVDCLESANSSLGALDISKREQRVHVPQRMPKTDYSQRIRVAPDLTDEDFPALGARGRGGAGRGRGKK
ncbi:unnamed protein product, partial [Brenthis ino]